MEIFLAIIFVVVISEIIVSGTWQPFYFRFGIPLYKKSLLVSSKPDIYPDELNRHFETGVFQPILFKQISTNQLAFRERLFCWLCIKIKYLPVMHGLIHYHKGDLEIIGLANWSSLMIVVFLIALWSGFIGIWEILEKVEITILVIGGFTLLYFIQVKRFNRLFRILSEQSGNRL